MEDTGRQPGSGLACLALLLLYHGEPADVSNLAHRFAPDVGEIDTIDLLRAANAMLPCKPVWVFWLW